jgi:nicotinamide-nucleotide amidase
MYPPLYQPQEALKMHASLVITGSEIITGRRQDALVMPFAAMLFARGVKVGEVRIISDAPDKLCSTILDLIGQTDLVVVTGGLGLTPDDTTRSAIEELKVRVNPLSEGSIPNPVGSAQGIDLRFEGTRVVFLPGVPREALAMFPILMEQLEGDMPPITEIAVFGLREIEIAERIGPLAEQCGFLPKDMEITLIVPKSLDLEIRRILGRHALKGPDLVTTFGALLQERGLTCAAAESCTGGLVGHLITQVPGSSDYFLGSVVSYSNEIKTGLLGIDISDLEQHGAVSEQIARAMLQGVLKLTGADTGLAITGVAGPDGGTEEKPVGTVWICIGTLELAEARQFHFHFDRTGNKMVSAKAALFMLRTFIHDQDLYRVAHS